ncbi:MAG: HDOD domain-containing protein [candidate division WOR-3 bacterium]
MIQYLLTRKPFLDKNRNIFAYEVLFRSTNGVKPAFSPSFAPGDALTLFLAVHSFEQLAGDKTVMFSLGPDVLKDHVTALLPKPRSVLEVSDEARPVDQTFVQHCESLRAHGFRFCLTDFNPNGGFTPLLHLAEFVEIPIAGQDRLKIAEQLGLLKKLPVKTIASGVATKDDFDYCSKLGFDLFKGSFYYKSSAGRTKSISPSQLLLLELSAHLARDEDMQVVERIFKKNPDLTFGLLKLINSAFFRVQQKVTSIRQAIALLGYENLQKWVALLLFTIDHRDHTVNPLVEKVLIRGRMMEMLAERVTSSKTVADSAFITGILSFVTVLFGVALSDIIGKLNLAPEIQEALEKRQGLLGTLLAITEDLDDEDYEELEKKLASVHIRGLDVLAIETKATIEYQTSLNDDLHRITSGKEAQ